MQYIFKYFPDRDQHTINIQHSTVLFADINLAQ